MDRLSDDDLALFTPVLVAKLKTDAAFSYVFNHLRAKYQADDIATDGAIIRKEIKGEG